jgi:hypothetical protein
MQNEESREFMANSGRRSELYSLELGLVLDRKMGKTQWRAGVSE